MVRLPSIYLFFNDGETAATTLIDVGEVQQHQEWSSHHSPEHTSAWHLLKGTGRCTCALAPPPAYLIGGQDWPRRACQGPLSVGPGHQTQGPTLSPLLFEALGRLIGLLCRAPLWGSAQACSSCWVCRRRKEQWLIPLQVSLSVAALHFQWLRKVTSALNKPMQKPQKQKQLHLDLFRSE